MKDDNDGNDGNNTDTSNDEYHDSGEKIKVIIYDQYYSDNYGYYTLSFLSGVTGTESTSLFEYLVGLIEDIVLGEENSSGVREDGMIQYLYEAIVQDSGFAIILQLCLSLYVIFYGMAYLAGLKEVNKKELMIRIVKIGLVIAFTSENSWTFYNNIVVGFFKDGMDAMISMMSDLTDTTFGASLAEVTAKVNDTTVSSEASRFSYIDQMINSYTSGAVTKKIWGLFFGVWFGFLLIPVIYGLIIYFIWTATRAVMVYITAMLKLVFAIAIGPLFIIGSLFSKTEGMFKKWLVFMASRSLEIIILFTILYAFLNLLDTEFTNIFSMKACTETYKFLSWIYIDIFSTNASSNFAKWMLNLCEIAALIFIFRLIMDKIPMVANSLIDIEGSGTITAGGASGVDATGKAAQGDMFGVADDVMARTSARAMQFGKYGLNQTVSGAGWVGGKILNATGLRNAFISAGQALPFRGLGARTMDNMINKYDAEGKKKGLSGKGLEQYIRSSVSDEIAKMKSDDNPNNSLMKDVKNKDGKITSSGNTNLLFSDRNKAGLLGLDDKLLESRLARRTQSNLGKHMDKVAKDLKKQQTLNKDPDQVLVGNKMQERLASEADQWLKDNSSDGSKSVDMNKYLTKNRDKWEYSSKELAQILNNNKAASDQAYDAIEELKAKNRVDAKGNIFKSMYNKPNFWWSNTAKNPRMYDKHLAKKLGKTEEERRKDRNERATRYLSTGQFDKDKKRIDDHYNEMINKYRSGETALNKKQIEEEKNKNMEILLEKKRKYDKLTGGNVVQTSSAAVPVPAASSPVASSQPSSTTTSQPQDAKSALSSKPDEIDVNFDARKKEKEQLSKDVDDAKKDKDPAKETEAKNKLFNFSKKGIDDVKKDINKLNGKIKAAEDKITELSDKLNKTTDPKIKNDLQQELNSQNASLGLLKTRLGANEAQEASLKAIEATMTDEQKNN